jgi:predicted AAA+ superfamily ATPase
MNAQIEPELFKLNPWWVEHLAWPRVIEIARDPLKNLEDRVLNRDLITSLVGLRRTGKSTLVFQVIRDMLKNKIDPRNILYFTFEELPAVNLANLLRQIIDYQLKRELPGKNYIFLDEIQYVDGWNSVLKHYFDLYPQLKFVITGSSSLFIKTQSLESLAGRIQELILNPMNFGEYLRINKKTNTQESFWQYLAWGEFPYLEKLPGWAEKYEYVNEFVIKKVVENDLPRLKKIYGQELLHLLKIIIERPGQQIEIANLASDLGIARNTLREYLSLLEKTYLISQLFNLGTGFRTRSLRQRKIYPTSVNAVALKMFSGLGSDLWNHDLGLLVENFVHNYLRQQDGELYFWREREIKEIDFLQIEPEVGLPIEVKYQNQIRSHDLENLLYYCRKQNLKKAMVVTKYEEKTIVQNGVEIVFQPANTLVANSS